MFKPGSTETRTLLALGISLVMTMAVMTQLTAAEPQQQATATPAATSAATNTPAATAAPTNTPAVTATSVAPTVSPVATPRPTLISTPSTLPKTGGSDDGAAGLGLITIIVGVLILMGVFAMAMSRRQAH